MQESLGRGDDIYCALCGVPFGVDAELYRSGSVTDDDVLWSQFFIACKMLYAVPEWPRYLIRCQVREYKNEQPCEWHLSGIGRISGYDGCVMLPPVETSFDARKEFWPGMYTFDAGLAYARVDKYVPPSPGIPQFHIQ